MLFKQIKVTDLTSFLYCLFKTWHSPAILFFVTHSNVYLLTIATILILPSFNISMSSNWWCLSMALLYLIYPVSFQFSKTSFLIMPQNIFTYFLFLTISVLLVPFSLRLPYCLHVPSLVFSVCFCRTCCRGGNE